MTTEKEQPLTIEQFKAWLEGVEEMQDEGWTPSDAQWKKIRAKIGQLCESIQKHPQNISAATPHMQHRGSGVSPAPIAFPEHNPRPLDYVQPGSVTQQSTLNEEVLKQKAPQQPQQAAEGGSAGGPAVKTPNIDTSNGNYQSNFE